MIVLGHFGNSNEQVLVYFLIILSIIGIALKKTGIFEKPKDLLVLSLVVGLLCSLGFKFVYDNHQDINIREYADAIRIMFLMIPTCLITLLYSLVKLSSRKGRESVS